MAISQSPRAPLPDAMPGSNSPLWWALAGSIALHVVVLSLPGAPVQPLAPLRGELGPLTARIEIVPPPAPAMPPDPPQVLKNTLDPPHAQELKDPIKPKPRPEPRVEQPKPAPKPAAPRPPRTETAGVAPDRRGLDLRLPDQLTGGLGLRAPPSAPPEQLAPEALRETLGRLSETILFPPEALERGLEGEVTLLVTLGDNGTILDAEIASGSGHKVLDDAAIRAVLKLGTLGPSAANKSILLPVRFRIL